ncbi:hypothetical protein RvVAR0630_17880 [Agrobacterium vitis]|uniref:hypothetical protein n=1 Tax=Agrobacterium vitis TaxID=373 RepID=UPI0015D81BA0|nr:hypothetical protein [Agrobacterium vitis]BCH59164.1 hypothetical protein RvVAR0630_17880 [Agrobacterium vitis]
MITAISIILYFIAAFFAAVMGDLLSDLKKKKEEARVFAVLSLIFFTLAACLQIFG